MKPPFQITKEIHNLCLEISRLIVQYEGLSLPAPQLELRKHAKILTIQSSLAIEGNTLTINQVTDIINNKKIVGPKKDILEVKNAIKVYDILNKYDSQDLDSLLGAHKILMSGLIKDAGKLRKNNVGVRAGDTIVHMAPPYKVVPELMKKLFQFLKVEKDLDPLIRSSIFHYEFEFIHPFMDGNGRIGRLWQSVILYDHSKIFEYIPIETIIKRRQMEYYEALQASTKEGASTLFIKFMLEAIKEATVQFTKDIKPVHQTAEMRLKMAHAHFGNRLFNRKEYLALHHNISPTSATRDLSFAAERNILKRVGKLSTTKYHFL